MTRDVHDKNRALTRRNYVSRTPTVIERVPECNHRRPPSTSCQQRSYRSFMSSLQLCFLRATSWLTHCCQRFRTRKAACHRSALSAAGLK